MKRSNTNDVDQDQAHVHVDDNNEKSNLKGDYQNVLILSFLYLLQGDYCRLIF